MSSKLKRFLSLLLAFAMVLSIVPVSAEGSDGAVVETATSEETFVAQIERTGEKYTSLDAAFKAAQDADTIKLLDDVDEVVRLSVSDGNSVPSIVLDLNGKTWDCGYGTRINAVNLLVKDGTIGSNRRAEGFDNKVDVFHFGGHAKLPSKMEVKNVTFYAELHVNNMAPSDEELGLLATSKSVGRAFNATEVVLQSKQYDVVTVQKAAYLTVNGGLFIGGINAEEGSFVTDYRKSETTDSGETVDITKAKIVTIMAPSEWNYIRTERGVTITFVDPTTVENRSYMQFTLGENSQNFTVQRLNGEEWETVEPLSGKSTIQWSFDEFGSETFRVDWDNNGTYDRLVVLVKGDIREVGTKEELKNAIATANDGTVIKLTADIDYGTDRLEITKSIILDLGGHTLTTRAVNYGLALKNEGIIVTNGKLNHAGTVAAIKVWSADEISNLEIDVTGTSSKGNTINGIVIQKDANGVRTLKKVKIHSTAGQGVAVGIETYECGNANTLVIGNMENVTIDAKTTGMLISAPCGTATNCDIKGGESGIEICLKGNYSAWLQLVNSKVYGGEQAVYAHDEFNSNPDIVNNGTLKLVADSATKFATSANGELLKTSFARIEDTQVILPDLDTVAENTTTGKKYSDLHDALTECASGEQVVLLSDVDLGGATWTPINKFAGTFDGGNFTISNFHIDATAGHGGFFNVLEWATVKDLTLENVTATVGAYRFGTLARSINQTNIDNVTVSNVEVTTTGSSAFVAGLFCHGIVNSNMEVNNCTVEDLTVNAQNGAMLIAGITALVQKNGTEAEGTNILENLHVKDFEVVVNDTDGICRVGGLVGQTQSVWQNPRFNNCSVSGLDVTASSMVDVGGFMCYPGSWTYAENCTVEGRINVVGITSASNYAGGFFGNYGWGDNIGKGDHKVTNCTADVDIITKIATAGGFVGSGINIESRNKNITLTNCEAKGTVTCIEGGTATIGGFAGYTDRGNYIDCTAAQEPFIGNVSDVTKLANRNSYVAKVGDSLYATFDAALAAAKVSEFKAVEMLAPVVLSTEKAFDLEGVTVTGDVFPMFRIVNGANVTMNGGNVTNGDYVFVLGASDGSSAGYLTIESGSYTGETTVASVTKGELTVTGGEFKVTDEPTYLLNCIDANYQNGTAEIEVKGGVFTRFDPMNNAAEGANTNYVAEGYTSETKDEGATYAVRKLNYVAQVGETKYEDLKEAIEACTNGETVMLIADIEYGSEDVVYAHGGATGFGNYDQYNPSIIYIGGTKGETEAENQPSNVNAVIDLNGHSITNNASAYLFLIMDNAKVTFTGNGSVINNSGSHPAIWAVGAETLVTITSGNYVTNSPYGVVHVTHSADMTITGGSFSTTADDASLLVVLNSQNYNDPNYFLSGVATISISGGSFKGFNPELVGDDYGASTIEEIKFFNGCATGYEAVLNEENGWYTVQLWDYEIWNKEDLYFFAELANDGFKFEKTVQLMNDVDLEGETWTPIAKFGGVFAGNDHTISNFNIDATAGHSGFFDVLEWATVKDLTLADVTATVGDYRFGTLARSVNQTNIDNVTVSNVEVTTTGSSAFVAGLFCHGTVNSNMEVNNCTVEDLTVNAQNGAMLIAGITTFVQKNGTEAEGTNILENLHVKNFKVTINDTDGYAAVGGLVGQTQTVWQNPRFNNCSVTGLDVTASGNVDVGGFICYPGSWTYAENCSAAGKINVAGVTSASNYAGGFFGNYGWGDNVSKGDHKVTNCTANVEIITKIATAGGFVGSGTNSEGRNKNITLTNCKALGTVTCVEGGTAYIGGFAGEADRGTYTNCTAAQEPFIGYVADETKLVNNNSYVAKVGDSLYATFDAALAAAKASEEKKVEILAPVVLTTDKEYDLADVTVTNKGDVYPLFRIQNGANVTVKGGTVTNNDYVFVLGASDGSSAGYLTISGGTYTGDTTMASVTKGTLTVTGGEFKVTDSGYGTGYLLNCIDANYNSGAAKINVMGGTFYMFDPSNNAAEGEGTSFLADGYISEELKENYWTVRQSKDALDPIMTITFTDSNSGETVTLKYPSERYDTIQKLIGTNDYADFVLGAEQSELLAYIADGRASNIVITLHDDVALDAPINFYNKYFQVPVEYAITLDGNGHTITWADGYTGTLLNVESGVSLTTKNLTIDGENAFTFYNDTTTVENGQNWYTRFVDVGEEDKAINANVIVNAGNLTLGEGTKIQNVTIASNGANGKTENTETGYVLKYNDDLAVIKSNGGTVNMNGATITGNAGMILNAVNASTSINATISGNMGAGDKGGIIIVNGGTANIAGSITGNKAMARSATILGVINGAEVTFTGTMENNKQIGVGGNTAGAMVVLEGASQFVMNGGSISGNVGGRAGAIASRWATADALIELNAGEIKGNTADEKYGWNGASIFLRSPATIGEGMTAEGPIVVNAAPGELEITGGSFTGSLAVTDGLTAAISGGTFNYDPSEWVVEGMVAVKQDEDTWTVDALLAEIVFQAFGGAETRITYPGYADSLQGLVDYYMLCNNANETALPGFSAGDYTPVLNIYGQLNESAVFGGASTDGAYVSAEPMTWTINTNGEFDPANIETAPGYVLTMVDEDTYTVTFDYVCWVQSELLAGNDVTLDRDIVVDGTYIESIPAATNDYGKYPNYGIFNVVGENVTFDLNGHNITYNGHATFTWNDKTVNSCTVAHGLFFANAGANLEICDSVGDSLVTVYGVASGVYSASPNSVINVTGGSWVNKPCQESGCGATNLFLYASHGGKVVISAGNFSQTLDAEGNSYLIVNHNGKYKNDVIDFSQSDITIYGGTFTGMNPEEAHFFQQTADNKLEMGETYNAVADGFIARKTGENQWTVVEGEYVAQIGDVKYESLQAAINDAKPGDEIIVLTNINLDDVEIQKLDGSHDTYFLVEGKSVTINLNGKTISGAYTGSMLIGVFSTDKNGHLTLTGNGTVDVTATGKVYTLITAFNTGSTVTIENGTYKLDKASDSLIYYGGETDAEVTVKGGTFTLGNVGEGENGKPWIFNVYGAGDHQVLITGGTFNADINRQHWSNEAVVDKTCYVVANDNGTWTVQEGAVAYVATGMLTGPYFYRKDVGYATIEEAFEAAVAYEDGNITLLKNVQLTQNVEISIPGIVLNANGFALDCNGNEIVLTAVDATLTAAENLNVTTDLEGYTVEYDAVNGLYKVVLGREIVNRGMSLLLTEQVYVKQYISFVGFDLTKEEIIANGGVKVTALDKNGNEYTYNLTLKDAGVLDGYQEFSVATEGIPVAQLGDTLTFRPYVMVDGEEIYAEWQDSARMYSERKFESTETSESLKSVLAALMNYGAAAQKYFNYRTSDLMNASLQTYVDLGCLKAEYLQLNWADSYLTAVIEPTEDMTLNFQATDTLVADGTSLNLRGALYLTYYYDGVVEDMDVFANATDKTFYIWTADKYNALAAAGAPLTKDNASYTVSATYDANAGEFAAKSQVFYSTMYGDAIYTALCVTDANGIEHCSGVSVDSPENYAARKINDGVSAKIDNVVKWMVVYGERAKILFNK